MKTVHTSIGSLIKARSAGEFSGKHLEFTIENSSVRAMLYGSDPRDLNADNEDAEGVLVAKLGGGSPALALAEVLRYLGFATELP